AITLDKAYGVIHVGLPITADIETLDIDTTQGETLVDKPKLIKEVNAFIERSRGLWAGAGAPSGDTIDGLTEIKMRSTEGYDEPSGLKTGSVHVMIRPEWNSNGRV